MCCCATSSPASIARKVLPETQLNLDHVTPRDKGGRTTWENIVTSCFRCNTRKANKLPHEAGMHPRSKPFAPRWRPLFGLHENGLADESWSHFLQPERGRGQALSLMICPPTCG